jgi:hypothetical protein
MMDILWLYYGDIMDILWKYHRHIVVKWNQALVALGAAIHDRFQVSRSTCSFLPNWTRRPLQSRAIFSRHGMAQQLACLI